MNYGNILNRSLEITWRWKILWVLGFLASLGSCSNNFNNKNDSTFSVNGEGIDIPSDVIGVLIICGCLAIFIGIALWLISIIARGGLIAGVQQIEEEGALDVMAALRVGQSRFGSLFVVSLISLIPAILMLLTSWCLPACCLMFTILLVMEQIRLYAERAIVLENLRWMDAFGRAWQVFRDNFGPTATLWFIFVLLALAFGLVFLLALFALGLPAVTIFGGIESEAARVILGFAGLFAAAIISALINSVVAVFQSTAWTLAYREMSRAAPIKPGPYDYA